MARIPQSFIDELIARVDIVELIDSRVPLKKTGREFGACCPFHNEKTPSFTVSPQKQFYHCFGCGAHGTALSFVMEFDRLEFPDAVRVLADMVGLEVPVEQGDGGARGKPATPLYELMASAADFYRQTLKQMPHAIDYLKDRGLSGETAADYGIGFAPDGWDFVLGRLGGDEEANRQLARCGLVVRGDGDRLYDRFRNRVMFPIRDARGRTIAFGGRVIDKGEPKYLNSPETVLFQKGRELYGLFEVRQASRDIKRLLVVEGYMDVVALAEHGINYAVATLGTAATVEHFKRLFRVTDEVIFCFDGDRAGRQAAWRAVNNALYSLYEGREIKILFLPDGEDPDSLVQKDGAQALEELIDKSEPCLHYILEEISKRTGNAGRAEREKFGKELAGMFSHIPDEKLRDTFQDMVDKAYGLDAGKLGRQIAEKITKPAGNRPPDGMAVQKTPVRQVLMYLLHQPGLAARVENIEELAKVDIPGVQLLTDVLAFIREHGDITTAGILENWRHDENGAHLRKLAALPLVIEEDGILQEFDGAIDILLQHHRGQQAINTFSKLGAAGLKPSGMSAEEREKFLQAIELSRRDKKPKDVKST